MEGYETAFIELEQYGEDVITASVSSCNESTCDMDSVYWVIYYTDGNYEEVYTPDKPSICP